MHNGEESVLCDLLERGIHLIPSATAQLLSRSKVLQAKILQDFMLPGTTPIYNSHALLQACTIYRQHNYNQVVLKCDRKNAGLGIHIFSNIEELYNHATTKGFEFPFVIQPFIKENMDIRVIILGDHKEAYERTNSHNFRKNLHCGGKSSRYQLTDEQLRFCINVMNRGKFDYGHLDLMLTDQGHCYLTEINLRGGLKGAQISGRDYKKKQEEIHERLLKELLAN